MAGIFLAMVAMLALAACGGGGSEYMLPTGQDYSLRLVKGGDPNDVLASTERKGHIIRVAARMTCWPPPSARATSR